MAAGMRIKVLQEADFQIVRRRKSLGKKNLRMAGISLNG
jgi:hypothetical protein